MTITAAQYHNITSYNRFGMKGHRLDWQNRPVIYKLYRGGEYSSLPRPDKLPRIPLQHLHDPSPIETSDWKVLTIDQLSTILALSYGITGHTRSGGEDFYYRSAPSAGALYPVEIYMAAQNVQGLGSGLYHYNASGHRVCLLRSGDIMPFADTCIESDKVAPPPHVCFFFSVITFRSAWKYRERAFRYLLLDTGHALENLLLTLRAEGLSATVHYNIHRERADRLLGLDPKREICFASVRIAGDKPHDIEAFEEIDELPRSFIDAGRVSPNEAIYKEIEEITLASSTLPVHNHHPSNMVNHLALSPENWQQIKQPHLPAANDFPDAVISRRSRRNFIPDELPGEVLFELLSFLSRTSMPVLPSPDSTVSTGLLVQNVTGVPSGFYLCDFSNNRWGAVQSGRLCGKMAAACLDQQWLRNAAIHFCFLADLERLDRNWGARGYQYAMLNAGRLGQRIYLAAAAFGLGCCGIGALYDDEARTLLGLNESSALLYLVAAGPVK